MNVNIEERDSEGVKTAINKLKNQKAPVKDTILNELKNVSCKKVFRENTTDREVPTDWKKI